MKGVIKAAVRALVGDYQPYVILRLRPEAAVPPRADVSGRCVQWSIEDCARFSQLNFIDDILGFVVDDAKTFAWIVDDQPMAICTYWSNPMYSARRNFWPLGAGGAKVVMVETSDAARGRGYASALIAASGQMMFERGATQLFARVWHSNAPSLRAFQRAGWTKIAFVVEVQSWLRKRPFRWEKHYEVGL